MGKVFVFIASGLFAAFSFAETTLTMSIDPIVINTSNSECRLAWTPADDREDGSPLLESDIASYTIFAGTESGAYTHSLHVVGQTEVPCSDFEITNYVDHYFAGVTTDTNGLASKLSEETMKTGEELAPLGSPPNPLFFSGTIVIQEVAQ